MIDIGKLLKGKKEINDGPLLALKASVDEKLTSAERDNDRIYHERVPAEGQLEEISPASVVKATPYVREGGLH